MAEQKQTKGSKRLETIIEENRVRREKRRFLEELAKRMTIAKQGRAAYEKGDFADALKHYRRFMTLTAKFHDVEMQDLHPKLFDPKDRVAEALLISAISLDIAKIVDLLKSAGAREERLIALKVFRLFTIGMPFQGFVAEGLRKYIQNSKLINNKNDFQATYNAVKISGVCFVATAAFDGAQAAEVIALRAFRDTYLRNSGLGRGFINFYYLVGPVLATLVRKSEALKRASRAGIRSILVLLPKN